MIRRRRDLNEETKQIKWRKIGGGCHIGAEGKTYFKGDVMLATVEQIGTRKGQWEPLQPIPEPVKEETPEAVQLILKHQGAGKYAVINPVTGDWVNDKDHLLTKQEALDLIGG